LDKEKSPSLSKPQKLTKSEVSKIDLINQNPSVDSKKSVDRNIIKCIDKNNKSTDTHKSDLASENRNNNLNTGVKQNEKDFNAQVISNLTFESDINNQNVHNDILNDEDIKESIKNNNQQSIKLILPLIIEENKNESTKSIINEIIDNLEV